MAKAEMTGSEGNDGNDALGGGEGSDSIYGGAGTMPSRAKMAVSLGTSDTLRRGNDYLDGGSGDDTIDAGDGGNDTIIGSYDETIFSSGGDGNDLRSPLIMVRTPSMAARADLVVDLRSSDEALIRFDLDRQRQ
ncbi:MAG: hypothetical protein R3D81_09405 [Thalassovita sp.]